MMGELLHRLQPPQRTRAAAASPRTASEFPRPLRHDGVGVAHDDARRPARGCASAHTTMCVGPHDDARRSSRRCSSLHPTIRIDPHDKTQRSVTTNWVGLSDRQSACAQNRLFYREILTNGSAFSSRSTKIHSDCAEIRRNLARPWTDVLAQTSARPLLCVCAGCSCTGPYAAWGLS